MPLYKLSQAGRLVTWAEYQAYGYGLTHLDTWRLGGFLGPIAHWSSDLRLGKIEDLCPSAGRSIAHVFATKLGRPDCVTEYAA
jgi:hypothetical protein